MCPQWTQRVCAGHFVSELAMYSPCTHRVIGGLPPVEAECSPELDETSDSSTEVGHQELRGLHSMMVEMLRNSATQAEGIQKLLSELLQSPQAGKESESQQQARPRRPRERQRRAELDLRLKVCFTLSFLLNRCLTTTLQRLKYVSMHS